MSPVLWSPTPLPKIRIASLKRLTEAVEELRVGVDKMLEISQGG